MLQQDQYCYENFQRYICSYTSPNPTLFVIHSAIVFITISGSENLDNNGIYNCREQVFTRGSTAVGSNRTSIFESSPTAGIRVAPVNHFRMLDNVTFSEVSSTRNFASPAEKKKKNKYKVH